MFGWIVISMVAYVVGIHQGAIKATTLLILTCLSAHAWLLGNNRKVHTGLNLSLKFCFEKKTELISAI